MLLKSLEIQGFKTFPDKTILKFDEPLVAVIGPNGSGKSNVSDAIKWVLGEQSTKALRCSKMEDVIFKGTSERKAMNYAEVSLILDNSLRILNFDKDEINITRRYYRSGESEYLINKIQVRLKDINELFMDTGLGRDGYSIISQGKIDSIVSAKSEERREIFEEASGISKYRYRKEEAERRLSRTEDNLVRLRDVFTEVESRVEPLRKQAEKAEKFIVLDEQRKQLELSICINNLLKIENNLRTNEDNLLVLNATHDELSEKLDSINAQIEGNYNSINNTTQKIEEFRAESAQIREQIIEIDGFISLAKNEIKHNSDTITEIKQNISNEKARNSNYDKEITEILAFINNKETELELIKTKILEQSEKLIVTNRKCEEISEKIIALNTSISENDKLIAENNNEIASLNSTLSEIGNRQNSIDELIESEKDKILSYSSEIDELKNKKISISESISSSENSIKGYQLKSTNIEKKYNITKADMDKTALDIGEIERRIKILKDLEKNYEGFNHSVRTLMKDVQNGILKGVLGTVSSLINTNKEYDIAIETALGAGLQNVVVQNENSAKSCIEYLKRKQAGRATFLPLSTISGQLLESKQYSTLPGYIGIAAELVNCDEQFVSIKNFLLGRIIIADNLSNANVIAKRSGYKIRVVTLDGQVINSGGSFTGGTVLKNVGLLSRKNEITELSDKLISHNTKYNTLSNSVKAAKEELLKISSSVALEEQHVNELNKSLIETTSKIDSLQILMNNASISKSNLEKEKVSSDERINDINKQISAIQKKVNLLNEKSIIEQYELDNLNKEISNIKIDADTINNNINEFRISMVNIEKDIEIYKNQYNTILSYKTNAADILETQTSKLSELEKNNLSLVAQISSFNKEKNTLENKSKDDNNTILSLIQQRNTFEKTSSELRNSEKEISSEKEKFANQIAIIGERLENYKTEYNTLTAKLWDEFELTIKEAETQIVEIENIQQAQRSLNTIKNSIRALGSVNVGAVVEYKEVLERYEFLKTQLDDIEKSKKDLTKLISSLTTHMKEQFIVKFQEINKHFRDIFTELFGGGTAMLSFSDENDILNSGIEITVHPPGKIVSNIEALSGGEKALCAISIYFAIMKVAPPPFCMLDEVEAALDDANVIRFSDFLHRMNDNTQFIVVTHRRGTMESADALYGVTMQEDGISKILSIKNDA